MSIADKIIQAKADYDAVYDAGYAAGVKVGGPEEEIEMYNIGDYYCCAEQNGIYASVQESTVYVCYSTNYVTQGETYKVICSPMNPDNLWQNFLFASLVDHPITFAVTPNDESVGQYVTKVNDTTYLITVPENCEQIHINCTVADGCRMYLANGYVVGYKDGKQAEYDAFWDAYQQNGERTDYERAFKGAWWNDSNFKPKYDIKPVGTATELFANSGITDLKGICEERGIAFDFSQVTYTSKPFEKSKITRLPIMDLSSLPNCSSVFNSASALVWVDGIILNENGEQNFGTSGSNWVLYATIAHFPILSGLINTNCWLILHSLDKESIVSAINALSAITSGLFLSLSKRAVNNAFETSSGAADGSDSAAWSALIATKSNWTISLV